MRVVGLDETVDRFEAGAKGGLDKPLRNFFERGTIAIQNDARQNAPVNDGQLRGAIAREIDPSSPPMWGAVGILDALPGSPLYAKAAAMEFGTGLLSDSPRASRKRHFPPPAALEGWARKHGFRSGWAVALAIFRKGGLKPRKYLRNATRDFKAGTLDGLKRQLADDVVEALQR